ncbi:uncharacterized protein LOC122576175 isoform X2 [Bombus pyrosoma]|uniref:uncharacterized protein LOC122576175 isoform X2 n=1 Tax=Bombus pyrosoma TaxID=396416 RepID=UPI001CB93088|nr:uncharacterized protein LOC122576175 isoform X2 [Bombus pyrosoma]
MNGLSQLAVTPFQIMRSDTSMDSLNVTRSESVTDLNTELNGLLHSRRASTGYTRNERTSFLRRLNHSESFLASPNMVGGKLGLPMTTLHEETSNTGNQLSTPVHDEDEEKSDADYSEYDSYQINAPSMSSSGYSSQAVSTTNLTFKDSISVKSISVDETPDLEYRNLLDYKKPERMDSSLVEETPEEYMGEVTNALGNLNVMENTCGEEHTRKNRHRQSGFFDEKR